MFLENNIGYENQTYSEKLCCYHLKRKKLRMMVNFIANMYKKFLYLHYQKQLYIKVKVTRGKYC